MKSCFKSNQPSINNDNNKDDDGDMFQPSVFKVRFFNLTDTSSDTLSSFASSNCDLTIFISQTPTLRRLLPIQLRVVFNSVLFSEHRIKDMLDQLQVKGVKGSSGLEIHENRLSSVTSTPPTLFCFSWSLNHLLLQLL